MNMFLKGIFLRRKIVRYFVLLLALAMSSNLLAQQSHTITEVARTPIFGMPNAVAFGPGGMVYTKCEPPQPLPVRLVAYSYDGSSLSYLAHITPDLGPFGITVGLDGTIYLDDFNGIQIYNFDGDTFTNTDSIKVDCNDIAVGPDGTIFVEYNGVVSAYSYSDTCYINTAQVDGYGTSVASDGTVFVDRNNSLFAYSYDGSSFVCIASLDYAADNYVIGPDGLVYFLVNEILVAYSYNDSFFTYVDSTSIDYWVDRYSFDMAAGPDGKVFVGGGKQITKLEAFSCDSSGFTNSTSIDIDFDLWPSEQVRDYSHDLVAGPGGLAFMAVGQSGMCWGFEASMYVYSYDGTKLLNTAFTSFDCEVSDIHIHKDGDIYSANGSMGFSIYTYDEFSFTQIAHTSCENSSFVRSVKVGSDGTIFLAGSPSLQAYTFDGSFFTNTASIVDVGYYPLSMELLSDSTIILACGGEGLHAYYYDGSTFTHTAQVDDGGYAQSAVLGADGTIFLANGGDGLRVYTYNDSIFTNTAHIDDGGDARCVAVGTGETIFLANGDDGLRAYTYNGSNFTNTAHIDDVDARKVAVGPDGTIFTGSYDSLFAYTYNGSSFVNTSRSGFINTPYFSYVLDIQFGPDGTIFVGRWNGGLAAYTYSGYSSISIDDISVPSEYLLKQNYPNPFNPRTAISYQLSADSEVELTIYDIAGRKIETLINEYQSSGYHTVNWDASWYSSGIYFYRLIAGDYIDTKKMILMK